MYLFFGVSRVTAVNLSNLRLSQNLQTCPPILPNQHAFQSRDFTEILKESEDAF